MALSRKETEIRVHRLYMYTLHAHVHVHVCTLYMRVHLHVHVDVDGFSQHTVHLKCIYMTV